MSNYDSNIFADNLNSLLEYKGITKSQLAEKMNVGKSTVSEWCNGKKLPRMDKVELLCSIFKISRGRLLLPPEEQGVDAGEISELYLRLSKSSQLRLLAYAYELLEKENTSAGTDMSSN